MGQTITLYPSGGKYGWGSTAESHTAGASDTFYAGHWYNGSAYRDYDAAIYFSPDKSSFGNGLPIVVTNISLTITAISAPKGPLNICLNTNELAVPSSDGFLATTEAIYDANNLPISSTFSFNISREKVLDSNIKVLNNLANWLSNGTNFVLHEYGSDFDTTSYGNWGGKFKGFRDTNKPKLEITWEYAATKGTLSANSYNTGSTAKLTIDPKDSSFKHTVTWTIGGTTFTGTNSGNVYSCPINPTSGNINSIFGNGKTASGEVSINTKTKDDTTDLGTEKYSFEVILTANTCLSTGNIVFNSTDLSVSYSNSKSALGSKYVVGESKISATGKFNRANNNVTASLQVVFSGGYSGTVDLGSTPNSSLSGTTSGYISSKKDIKASFILTDSRGLKYQIDKTISASQIYIYQAPIINSLNFYRCNSGGNEDVEGTYLGGDFQITLDPNFISSNRINTVTLKFSPSINSSSSITIPASSLSRNNNIFTYSSTNFIDKVDTSLTYVITLMVTDQIGGTNSIQYTLSPAKYILHIPSGGRGIGIGTVGADNYIKCGWTLDLQKGFKIDDKLDFSSVTTQEGFQQSIGGPFLPTAGGTVTGEIKLAYDTNKTSKARITAGSQTLLAYKYSSYENGTLIATHTAPTAIRGSELKYLKEISENSFVAYDILHSGNYTNYDLQVTSAFPALGSKFKVYSNNNDTSHYPSNGVCFKKYGKMVEVYGAISPVEEIEAGGDEYTICEIPTGYIPKYVITRICQGSYGLKWLLQIRPSDESPARLTFSRYGMSRNGNSNDYMKTPATAWLTFHETWIID